MAYKNYKNIAKVKAIDAKNEKRILSVNPNIDDNSGIYFLTRKDSETGIRFSYVGQARHIKSRILQHLRGFQKIDISVRAHGLLTKDNPDGWDINFLHFPLDKLDEMERYYITLYAKEGYQSRNIDTGGGKGKREVGERKAPKGYRDGIKQGKVVLARQLTDIINKHLSITIKEDKRNNKISQKAQARFYELINEDNYKENK